MEDIEIEQRAKEYKNAVKELKPLNNHKLLYEEGFNQGIKKAIEVIERFDKKEKYGFGCRYCPIEDIKKELTQKLK